MSDIKNKILKTFMITFLEFANYFSVNQTGLV